MKASVSPEKSQTKTHGTLRAIMDSDSPAKGTLHLTSLPCNLCKEPEALELIQSWTSHKTTQAERWRSSAEHLLTSGGHRRWRQETEVPLMETFDCVCRSWWLETKLHPETVLTI